MSIHWRSLDTTGKIEAVRSVYQPGMSASEIAAQIDGATRNAVVGIFYRHLEKIGPLAGKSGPKTRVHLRGKVKKTRGFNPLPTMEEVEGNMRRCSMLELRPRECRWPVNDAGVGEQHLFCGLPADGSYCDHHTSKAYRTEPNQCGS